MIVKKRVGELTKEEYLACKSLNMRQDGEMRTNLAFLKRLAKLGRDESIVYLIWEESVLVAWALCFPITTGKTVSGMFYVRKTYRRKGLGRSLWSAMLEDHNKRNIKVYPHDKQSLKFFHKMGKTKAGYWYD